MNDNQVKAVMIAVAIVVALIAAVKIRRGLRRFFNSAEVRLVRELARSVQNGELQQEEPPKSLGGMTSIYLPQILRDFPEFNWEELRAEALLGIWSPIKAETHGLMPPAPSAMMNRPAMRM